MKRWLILLTLTGCVGGLDSTLRIGRQDAATGDEPSASMVLDAGLDALVVTPTARDADVHD